MPADAIVKEEEAPPSMPAGAVVKEEEVASTMPVDEAALTTRVLAELGEDVATRTAQLIELLEGEFPGLSLEQLKRACLAASQPAAADVPAEGLEIDDLEAGLAAIDLTTEPRGRSWCRAKIKGLQARPELNGRLGVICEWNAARGRYAVRLDGCGTNILLRVDNLDLDDVVTALLRDDRQPRDWPHRGGVDTSPALFTSLWKRPFQPGDPGAVASPPCQCARPACESKTSSCGICIDDPVICWNCLRSFSLYCVGDGPDGLQRCGEIGDVDPESVMGAELDRKAKFKEWAMCPQCGASLGAAAMPRVFRSMIACQVFARPGQDLSLEDAGLEFLALFSEQMYAFGQASQANTATDVAIKNFTRSIHCANHVRCLSPDLFDGDCRDFFLLAHARRARLEGDMAQGERIVAHFDRQGSGSLRDYRFRDASGVTLSLFSLADIRATFPGAELTQMLGEGASATAVQQMRATGMNPLSDDKTDWGYDRLSHEGRELNFWMFSRLQQGRPPPRLQPFQLWDFRWAFTRVVHAQDYFQVLLRVKTEEKCPMPAANLTRTTLTLSGLPEDSECVVLTSGVVQQGPMPMASLNALFRVGRVCAKVYVVCFISEGQREEALQKCLALASHAAAKSWELAQEPHSVSTAQWESARARVMGTVQ